MNVLFNFSFSNALNSMKTALQSVPAHQQKVISIVAIIFASISSICFAYCYCFKAKQNPSSNEIPEPMAKVFKKYHYDPCKLPVLDMTLFPGSTDYIQYIKPQDMKSPAAVPARIDDNSLETNNEDIYSLRSLFSETIKSPVMQFKDAWGRKGIALHIHGKDTSTRQYSIDDTVNGKVSDINGVWTFHQRYVNEPTVWVGGVNELIKRVINQRHDETDHVGDQFTECPDCPIIGAWLMSDSLIENLLTNNDPDFQLGEAPNFNLLQSECPLSC